ncbi:MAG: hypothetical protein IIB78_03220 [Proteobacteria bacterium]|nr:hypothetical protein [Pseudomonadota bacterium]
MIVAETIFVDSRPAGVLRQGSNSGQIGFSPLKGESLLPQKHWRDIDQLKAAVRAAYSRNEEGPLNDQ